MKTYFDSPERSTNEELKKKIDNVNSSKLMEVFLNSISGLLAVIDEHRQLISFNKAYCDFLEIENTEELLGLRQGEILNCIHAHKAPHGCGTTEFCQSCSAAIAIAISLAEEKTVERYCAIKTQKEKKSVDLYLQIKCEPIVIEKTKFLLLFLHDRTKEQQRIMLERSFFHDFSNMIGGLATANYLLSHGKSSEKVFQSIDSVTKSLIKELEVQRCLMNNDIEHYRALTSRVYPKRIFEDLDKLFQYHPAKENKNLNLQVREDNTCFHTDGPLIMRILANMITNALEATEEGGVVNIKWEIEGKFLKFIVHNDSHIPEQYQLRIFQRNFSTKGSIGRGIGTYSMKFFGEVILKGKVGFTSDRDNGTDFFISLPM